MEILFEIWLRLLERHVEEVIAQDTSGGVVSFLLIGILLYFFKQELRKGKECQCCLHREKEIETEKEKDVTL